jgi:hypothetical protein
MIAKILISLLANFFVATVFLAEAQQQAFRADKVIK